jgi:hypothetical protein
VKTRLLISLVLLMTLAATAAAQAFAERESGPVEEAITANSIHWEVEIPYESVQLRVKGSAGVVFQTEIGEGFAVRYDLIDQFGRALPDGRYAYELRITPKLDRALRQEIGAQRAVDDPLVRAAVRQILNSDRLVHSGYLMIRNGSAVTPNEPRSLPGFPEHSGPVAIDGSGGGFSFNVIAQTDSTIKGDLCVGDGCPGEGEPLPVFGESTLLLMMDRDVRIKFDDTSVDPDFAARDWQIGANDAGFGGVEKFFIQDCGMADEGLCPGSLIPFTILGDSRNNALFVDTDGHVGLGTSTPATLLHGISGDSPAIRLEQDGSMALAPQSWDVGGNENSFFVRDVTGGGLTPFQVQPGAPSNSFTVSSAGNVGLGIAAPARQLHLSGTNATFRMDRDQDTAAFILVRTNAMGSPLKTFVVGTNASGANNGEFIINDLGQNTGGAGARRMTITNSGEAHFTGTVQAPSFVQASSLRYKENVNSLSDPVGIVSNLRGVSFNWKETGKLSVGLIAEELAEVLPALVGRDETSGEVEGINYSGVVAVLVEAVKAQQSEIETLRAELAEMRLLQNRTPVHEKSLTQPKGIGDEVARE